MPFVLPLLIQLSAGASNSGQANVYQVKAAKEADDRGWQIFFTRAREYDNPPATLLKAIERIRPTGETVTFSFINPEKSEGSQLVRLQWQNQGRGELTGTLLDPTGTQHTISKVIPTIFPIPALQLVTSKSVQVIPSDSVITGIKVSPYVDISTFVENARDEREKSSAQQMMRKEERSDRQRMWDVEDRNWMQMMEGVKVDCPICFDRMKLDGSMVMPSCGFCVKKYFCRACLNQWKVLHAYGQNARGYVPCPTCNKPLH